MFPGCKQNRESGWGGQLTYAVHLGGKAFIHFFVEFARAIIKTKSFVNEVKKERVEMVWMTPIPSARKWSSRHFIFLTESAHVLSDPFPSKLSIISILQSA